MGNPEKGRSASPVPLPESPGSALQKLKKALNTVTTRDHASETRMVRPARSATTRLPN